MERWRRVAFAAAFVTGMVVAAMWCWAHAVEIGAHAAPSRPDVGARVVRAVAAAAVAWAQAVVVVFVLWRLFPRRRFDRALLWCASLAAWGAGGYAVLLPLMSE